MDIIADAAPAAEQQPEAVPVPVAAASCEPRSAGGAAAAQEPAAEAVEPEEQQPQQKDHHQTQPSNIHLPVYRTEAIEGYKFECEARALC